MAGRIRTMKPEFLEDETTAALSNVGSRLFVGAILVADDYGNLRCAPPLLASQVFWHLLASGRVTVAAIADGLVELLAAGLLTIYRVRGQNYAHIVGWEKHQRVDKPGRPRIPSIDDPAAELVNDYAGIANIREDGANDSRESREVPATDLRPPTSDLTSDHDQRPGASAPVLGAPAIDPSSAESRPASDRPDPLQASPVSAQSQAPLFALDSPKPSTPSVPDLVFARYVAGWHLHIKGNRPPILNPARKKFVTDRIREGFTPEDLIGAADGIWRSQWHVSSGNYAFDFVFRNTANVEKFRDMRASSGPAKGPIRQSGSEELTAKIEANRILLEES